ncbi:MAG: hypothetical protein U0990_06455, partial [Candidatus Nanopelagicales bacterium]|nr:hypothetical protein [Candidatus Nanopelagicales bacterium]
MARDQLERAISNAYRTINRTWTPEYRHYGPGEHPGTGTDQQAHAGDGAAATDVADRPKAGTSPEGQSGGGAWLADMAAGMKKPGLYEVADQGEQLKAFGQRLFDIGEAIENRPQGQGALPPDIAKYLQYSIGRHQFAFQQSQDSSDPNAPLESVSGEALNKSFDAVAGALEMYEFEMARHKLTPSFEELTALQEIRSALGTHRGPEFDPEDEFYDLTVEMANHTFERAPLTTDDPGRLALFEQPWFQRQAMELLENGDVEAWTVRAPWAEGFEDGQVVPDVITLARQADVLGSSDYHPDVKSFYFDVFRHLADVPGTPEAAYMIGQFGGEWRFQLDNLIMRYAPGQWVPPDEAKYGEGVEQVVDYVNTAWTESARHPASIALMEEVSR